MDAYNLVSAVPRNNFDALFTYGTGMKYVNGNLNTTKLNYPPM